LILNLGAGLSPGSHRSGKRDTEASRPGCPAVDRTWSATPGLARVVRRGGVSGFALVVWGALGRRPAGLREDFRRRTEI